MPQPAAASTALTLSRACFVCAPTSPGPMSFPAGAVMPWEYMPSAGPSSFEVTALGGMRLSEPDVRELDRLAVDAAGRRGNPARELAGLGHRVHETLHVGLVLLGGQPLAAPGIPLRLADHAAVRRHARFREHADGPVEAAVRQG